MMMTTPRPDRSSAGEPQAPKRSVLGLLFNPQLGPAFSPLRESTNIFLRLLANVFVIYKLLPKDFPGLTDETVNMSFVSIMSTAWNNVSFTREGAPRTILFFAILTILLVSGLVAGSAVLSLFISHAHADTTTSVFAPSSSDLAQSWLDYLFNVNQPGYLNVGADTIAGGTATIEDPFSGVAALREAFIAALAIYSDAILIIAAVILFYHLTAMVVETAHHGVPMGKNASQIWAPIRLVVAIGLLVPINGGLSSGQFIVVKMASLGSGLASHTWEAFLTKFASFSSTPAAPASPLVEKTVDDMIMMEACKFSWNAHIAELSAKGGVNLQAAQIQGPTLQPATVGGVSGQMYTYSSNSIGDTEVCGSIFFPQPKATTNSFANDLLQKASSASIKAYGDASSSIKDAGAKIENVMVKDTTAAVSAPYDGVYMNAVYTYQKSLRDNLSKISQGVGTSVLQDSFNQIGKYGWAMAGALLNTIDRVQGDISNAAQSVMPTTVPPLTHMASPAYSDEPGISDYTIKPYTPGPNTTNLKDMVAADLKRFSAYQVHSVQSAQSMSTKDQCAAMVGLAKDGSSATVINSVFWVIDYIASWQNVWKRGDGESCGAATDDRTLALGIKITGTNPLTQLAALGHANIGAASLMLGLSLAANAGGGIANFFGKTLGKLSGAAWSVASGLLSAAGGVFATLATIFWTCGFMLAFIIPLMPFMRFFFSVLSWMAGVIEAVLGVPLIALAHLSPQGDGLPGQAKTSYYFVFNLFVRPIMTVFGLVAGLIMFMIALSFLNYGYEIATAGAGATVYGQATMSKVLYSILYVILVFVSANHSFMLIDHLPTNALRWMGGASGQSMHNMGDVGKIENMSGGMSVLAGRDMINTVSAKASDVSGRVSDGFTKRKLEKVDANKKLVDHSYAVDQKKFSDLQQFSADNGMTVQELINNPGQHDKIVSQMLGADAKDASTKAAFLSRYNDRHKPKP